MNRLTLRASKADHAYACPPSLDRDWPDDPTSEPAAIGSGVHEAMTWHLKPVGIDEDRLMKIETKYGVDPSSFRPAYWQTVAAFEQIRGDLPMSSEMESERLISCLVPVPGGDEIKLTGHIDLCDFAGETGFIVDYKTGWVVRSCELQMRVYAALLLILRKELSTVRVYVLRPRLGEMELYEWSRSEILDDWLPAFVERIALDEQHRPHPATCKYCGLLSTCKPAQERMRGEALALVQVASTSLSPAQMVDTLRKVRAIKAQAEEVEEWIRVHATASSRIEGDGFAIEIDTTDKEHVDLAKARPVLSRVLDHEEIDSVLTVGKIKLENAIKKKAPHGKKSKFLAQVWEELDAAGAIEITTSERMEVRSIHQQDAKQPEAIAAT